MLFRSKTAIKVRFQKLFNTKDSSKSFSQLFNVMSMELEILQSKLKKSQQS